MPRKNRRTALVLVLALLAGLAAQAAVALPLGPRLAGNDTTAGGFLTAVWGWFTSHWAALGQLIAGPAKQGGGLWEKVGGSHDPNGGPGSCMNPGPGGSPVP